MTNTSTTTKMNNIDPKTSPHIILHRFSYNIQYLTSHRSNCD